MGFCVLQFIYLLQDIIPEFSQLNFPDGKFWDVLHSLYGVIFLMNNQAIFC